ncbi:MAG: type II toxin-antitoxin system RelE/ParE family toxin, partial [Methylobacteriaceae bacterium]|nr:type II toxin-antitoxin system RelE/ParE family toxin [Methylobacteriaceae bacterium]
SARRGSSGCSDQVGRLEPVPVPRDGPDPNTREWIVTGLPYIIVYEIDWDRDEIVVLNVFHGAQDRS